MIDVAARVAVGALESAAVLVARQAGELGEALGRLVLDDLLRRGRRRDAEDGSRERDQDEVTGSCEL